MSTKQVVTIDRASQAALYHCSDSFIQPASLKKCGPYKTEYEAVQMTGLPIEVLRNKFKNWKPEQDQTRINRAKLREEFYE